MNMKWNHPKEEILEEKRRSRQGYDSLRRDDFWNCDLQPETSPCEFNKFLSDFGSF